MSVTGFTATASGEPPTETVAVASVEPLITVTVPPEKLAT